MNNEIIGDANNSNGDAQRFFTKMWELLSHEAQRYNGADSTSMTVERAQDLMASLMYTFTVVSQYEAVPMEAFAQQDFEQVLKRGRKILSDRKNEARQAFDELCRISPKYQNVYYLDTIKNIDLFFKRYDIYYDAHQIPCSIDYPLLNPVSEDLKGVDYIDEYINRIGVENQFVNCFDFDIAVKELKKSLTNYIEDFTNLCAPIFVKAIGRILLGYEPLSLEITADDNEQLNECFIGKSKEEIVELLNLAVRNLCELIEFNVDNSMYFEREIDSLAVRIEIAVGADNLSNIFQTTLSTV